MLAHVFNSIVVVVGSISVYYYYSIKKELKEKNKDYNNVRNELMNVIHSLKYKLNNTELELHEVNYKSTQIKELMNFKY
jgi:hypothetical protein